MKNKLYNQLYEEMEGYLEEYNPCQHTEDGCVGHPNRKSRCCSGCKHLGRNGCKVKSLACKLWVCSDMIKNLPPDILTRIYEMNKKADDEGILKYRDSKKECFVK